MWCCSELVPWGRAAREHKLAYWNETGVAVGAKRVIPDRSG